MQQPDARDVAGSATPVRRLGRVRRGLSIGLIALLLIFVVAGGTLAVLVQFRGYCPADFLPIGANIEAPPYVQNVTSTAATVMWRTPGETEGIVEFGETAQLGRSAGGELARLHAVRLTGLQPDTEYMYRVQSPGIEDEIETFRTAPGPEGEVEAVVVGDTGSGDTPQEKLSAVMLGIEPDLVLHTGDVVYPRGGECGYEERFYEPYNELIASAPVYPVLGNHDVLSENGEPYLTAFDLPAEKSGTERFYSFDYGPLHVAALDSELYYGDDSIPTEQQKEWLREDLRNTDRPWKIVIIHRPPYNSSPYHGADQRVLEDLVEIFEEGGVDVVFAGHEHVYERLKPINGVQYFVTGGGGADLRGGDTSDLTLASALVYHALRMEASPERLLIEAVDIDGEIFDQVELTRPSTDASQRHAAYDRGLGKATWLIPTLRKSERDRVWLRGRATSRRSGPVW
jgi:3',5'-cyclic AMP phosphodiesterase CpdA